MEFEALDTPIALLGEGPFWDSRKGCLGFVDILQGRLHLAQEDGTLLRTIQGTGDLSAAVPIEGVDDQWLVARGSDIGILHSSGDIEVLANTGEGPGLRLNDGKCDARGRFWVGSMHGDLKLGMGALYRFGSDGDLTRMESGITLSNGLGWSPDNSTFYLIDTIPGLLFAWDFDLDSGELSRKRLLSDAVGPGMPDGLAVDNNGDLWIAILDGSVVRRFSSDGDLIEEYPVPVSLPTCPAFGGPDGMTLYVTSASVGLDAPALALQPSAGRVLVGRPGVGGPPANAFVHP